MGTLSPQFGSILPSQTQEVLNSNYLQFNTGGANDFIQQYLPEVYEQEVERYGNRTLSGFLRMVGAEMPMTSDQVIWSEQNRLHIAYDGVSQANGAGAVDSVITIAGAANMVMSVNDTVVVLDPANGLEAKCVVVAVNIAGGTATVIPFANQNLTALGISATGLKVFVYGSAYQKGTTTTAAGVGNSDVRTSVELSLIHI